MLMDTKTLIKKLERIAAEKQDSLKKEVAVEALTYEEDAALFFCNIYEYGCSDGLVGSLIYYADTHAFYDKYYEAIEELRLEYGENNGTPVVIK